MKNRRARWLLFTSVACAACTKRPPAPVPQVLSPAPAAVTVPVAAPPSPKVPFLPPKNAHATATGCRFTEVTHAEFALFGPPSSNADLLAAGAAGRDEHQEPCRDARALANERGGGLRAPSCDGRFATARATEPVTLIVGGPGVPSSLQFPLFGLDIDAQVPKQGFALYAKVPLTVAGVYEPSSYSMLRAEAVTDPARSALAVIVEPAGIPEEMPQFLPGVPHEALCTKVGLASDATFEVRALPAEKYYASTEKSALLSAQPKGAPVARLPAGSSFSVHGTRDGWTEISLHNSGRWHGWLPPTSVLQLSRVGHLRGSHTTRAPNINHRNAGLLCPEDLPLFVRIKYERRPLMQVGVVRANKHVAFENSTDDLYRTLSDEQRPNSRMSIGEIYLEPNLELVVEEATTRACIEDNQSP